MISDKSGLASRLGWVLEDTEHTLERTRQVFAEYVERGDEASLEAALEYSRETLGILDLLEAEGAYMLDRELVLLMDAIREGKVDDKDAAAMSCANGLLQLSDYLRHLHEGYADLPVIILPMLNDLRAVRKAELLSEHLVFLPNDGAISQQMSHKQQVELPAEKRADVLKRLRFYMQKALLGWFSDQRPEFHLQASRKVANHMLALHKTERTRSLWWVTAGLLQGLEEKKLESSVAIKSLMGRMEREIRRFNDLGSEAYEQTLPDELVKNLLYYVGLAERGGKELNAVKDAYQLDLYLPQGETLEELRQYYALPGRELWQSVAGSLQEELNVLMANTEELRDLGAPGNLLAETAKRTRSVGQALGMLGLTKAAELTAAQADEQHSLVGQTKKLAPETLTSMSEHYIKLDKVLTEYAETGFDLTQEVFAAEGEIADHAAGREVVRAMSSDISKVQAEIAVFSRQPTEVASAETAADLLRNLDGTLEMLDYRELQPFARGAQRYLQLDLLHSQRPPRPQEMDCLADVVTLLDAALSCVERQEDYLPLLSTGYDKLTELDRLSKIDLLAELDMDAARTELEFKKKARQVAPSTLYQKIRSQNLLATT